MGRLKSSDGSEEVKKAQGSLKKEKTAKKRTKARWTEDRKSEAIKVKEVVTEEEKGQKTKRKKVKGKGKDKKKQQQPEGHVHESAGQGKALKYLEKWDTDSDNWKFEKCRQIWLLQNCYDLAKIPDAKFDTLLKYMASIRGKMRESALESAQAKVSQDDSWSEEIEAGKTEADLILEKKKTRQPEKVVQRARDVVEMLA